MDTGAAAAVHQRERSMMAPSFIFSQGYYVDIGPHVFPMQKFGLTRQLLLELGKATAEDFGEPGAATEAQIAAVHTREYVDKVTTLGLSELEERVLEVPLSTELVEAFRLVAGGTIAACRRALAAGYAANLAGGFHHAFAGHGEGFCLLNDVAIGARAMLDEGRAGSIAVLDLDVHQGNGTAAIFADEGRVHTCSIHQQDNYPYEKQSSDHDIGLPDGAGGDVYLAAVERGLDRSLAGDPDLLIYVAGADPYEHDQLGGLALTIDDLRVRDRLVFERCRTQAVPVVALPAGGYAVELFDTVFIHAQTFGLGREICGVDADDQGGGPPAGARGGT